MLPQKVLFLHERFDLKNNRLVMQLIHFALVQSHHRSIKRIFQSLSSNKVK